ncbi:hypothetical protein HF086_009539 [Spodoptera exigua]|uniref:Peptidase M16 C-terminal domain-containing protein n=1 Tax=Spodoptera exigua TaxID=7107 RepID=A0A922MEW9_SPOEX|nr:hypothetical protein HF086_009539 [Spodoptera exigua]
MTQQPPKTYTIGNTNVAPPKHPSSPLPPKRGAPWSPTRSTMEPNAEHHGAQRGAPWSPTRSTMEPNAEHPGALGRATPEPPHTNAHSIHYENEYNKFLAEHESLDDLEAIVVPLFSEVQDTSVTPPSWPEHPFPPELRRKRAYCLPVKDLRSLSIDFPIPDTRKHYKSGVTRTLSITSAGTRRTWNLVGGTRIGARGFGFFGVQVDLTEDGVSHIDDIIKLVFQYISMLKAEGPQRWVWEEQRDLMALEFRLPKDGTPLCAQQLLLHREIEIEKGAWHLRETTNSVHKSSCASLYYACGVRQCRTNVTLELLAHTLAEPCFNMLRTKVYNFDRPRVEVEQLNTITKEELIQFYKRHIAADSPERQKLSVYIVSTAEGGAGHGVDYTKESEENDNPPACGTDDDDEKPKKPTRIVDLVDFKCRRPLYPHPSPFINIPRKGSQCKL